MISRIIESYITPLLGGKKAIIVMGARQVGKTYIIRHVGKKLFENFIEINMVEDSLGDRLFCNPHRRPFRTQQRLCRSLPRFE